MLLAVKSGCKVIRDIYDSPHTQKDIREKSGLGRLKDLQTRADTETEALIKDMLAKEFPDIGFFGEESSEGNVADFVDKPYFILDPIDGTSNFITGNNYFALSLGYVENQKPYIGIIGLPLTHEMVFAEKGHGAYQLHNDDMNKELLPETLLLDLHDTQLHCEFSFEHPNDIAVMLMLTPYSLGMRKHGSTAADIAQMVCGRHSALIANNQKSYDIAAGIVIAEETGFIVSDWSGNPALLTTANIVIANPKAHAQIIALLNESKHD